LIKKRRMRHQSFFQAGAVWWFMILALDFCSALTNTVRTVGFTVMIQLHVVVRKPCSSCWQTPPPLQKQGFDSPCRLFNEAEPFQPLLPKRQLVQWVEKLCLSQLSQFCELPCLLFFLISPTQPLALSESPEWQRQRKSFCWECPDSLEPHSACS